MKGTKVRKEVARESYNPLEPLPKLEMVDLGEKFWAIIPGKIPNKLAI